MSVNKENITRTKIRQAAINNQADALRDLIKEGGAAFDEKDDKEMTPLMHALENGSEAAARVLIESKADLMVVGPYNYTMLHYAAKGGCSSQLIKQLLTLMGKDILNKKTQGRFTPLMTVLKWAEGDPSSKYNATIATLIEAGALITTDEVYCGVTDLHYAVDALHPERIDLVLKHAILQKANIDKGNELGITPLMKACAEGHPHIVEVLVEAKADIMAKDSDSNTPLKWILLKNNTHLIPFLMDQGAIVDFDITKENDAADLLRIYPLVKPCFNQENLRPLAQFIEILYLRNPKNNPILNDRKALKDLIKVHFEYIKDLYFKNHREIMQQAEAILNAVAGRNDKIKIEEFMIKVLVNYIANFLLREKNNELFWKPFIDAAMEKIEPTQTELPADLAVLLLEYAIPVHGLTSTPKASAEKEATKNFDHKEAREEEQEVDQPLVLQMQCALGLGNKPMNLDRVLFELRLEYFSKNILRIKKKDENKANEEEFEVSKTHNPFFLAFHDFRARGMGKAGIPTVEPSKTGTAPGPC